MTAGCVGHTAMYLYVARIHMWSLVLYLLYAFSHLCCSCTADVERADIQKNDATGEEHVTCLQGPFQLGCCLLRRTTGHRYSTTATCCISVLQDRTQSNNGGPQTVSTVMVYEEATSCRQS